MDAVTSFNDSAADELIARARDLRGLLARNAAAVEQSGRLTDENIAALERAELFGIVVPRRWGGSGASLATFLKVGVELGKGCPSTAWVHYISSEGAWTGSTMPEAVQRELFANGPFRQCGVATSGGTAKSTEGGFRVTGRWGFASGCYHAKWATVSVDIPELEGQKGWFGRSSAWIPLTDLAIEGTWDVEGMRGTGSNTLVATDVFVPDRFMRLPAHVAAAMSAPQSFANGPSDRWDFRAQIVASSAGVPVGIAEGMLEAVMESANKRGISYTDYKRQSDSQIVQREIAEARMKIDAAKLIMLRNANMIDSAALEGQPLSYEARARVRGECGFIGQLLREAADKLISIGGASGFAKASPLQRYWRDLNMITRHAFLSTNPCAEIYGRALLGIEPNISPDI